MASSNSPTTSQTSNENCDLVGDFSPRTSSSSPSGSFSHPHACDQCSYSAATSWQLTRHQLSHKPAQKNLSCPVCAKKFATKAAIKSHLVSHEEAKNHRCDMCEAAFARPQQLTLHYKCHTMERPFRCEQCGNSYVQKGALTTHIQSVHAGMKFRCRTCPKTYTTPASAKRHCDKYQHKGFDRIQEGPAPEGLLEFGRHTEKREDEFCDACHKLCHGLSSLTRHIRQHHLQEPLFCGVCAHSFVLKPSLEAHLRSHPCMSKLLGVRRSEPSSGNTAAKRKALSDDAIHLTPVESKPTFGLTVQIPSNETRETKRRKRTSPSKHVVVKTEPLEEPVTFPDLPNGPQPMDALDSPSDTENLPSVGLDVLRSESAGVSANGQVPTASLSLDSEEFMANVVDMDAETLANLQPYTGPELFPELSKLPSLDACLSTFQLSTPLPATQLRRENSGVLAAAAFDNVPLTLGTPSRLPAVDFPEMMTPRQQPATPAFPPTPNRLQNNGCLSPPSLGGELYPGSASFVQHPYGGPNDWFPRISAH